jgi:hypothetical protein
MKISANHRLGLFIGILGMGTLLAGCGRNSNNVTKAPATSSGPRPEIKSTADLGRLLAAGMTTNEIVARLGQPTDTLPSLGGADRWVYDLTPFPAGNEWGSYVYAVDVFITNGYLASWGCSYYTPGPRKVGPEMTILGEGATTSSTQAPTFLKFFIVSSNQIAGGRFIDTDQFPKLGFIPPAPELVISTLKEVWLQEQRPNAGARNPNQNFWEFNFSLTEPDAARFASFTASNIDNKFLMMVGDDPVFSATIVEPISGGNFRLTTTNQVVIEEAKKLLANMAREK